MVSEKVTIRSRSFMIDCKHLVIQVNLHLYSANYQSQKSCYQEAEGWYLRAIEATIQNCSNGHRDSFLRNVYELNGSSRKINATRAHLSETDSWSE